jgi:hypothetical protein
MGVELLRVRDQLRVGTCQRAVTCAIVVRADCVSFLVIISGERRTSDQEITEPISDLTCGAHACLLPASDAILNSRSDLIRQRRHHTKHLRLAIFD